MRRLAAVLIVILLLAVIVTAAGAQVFHCVDAAGNLVPCVWREYVVVVMG